MPRGKGGPGRAVHFKVHEGQPGGLFPVTSYCRGTELGLAVSFPPQSYWGCCSSPEASGGISGKHKAMSLPQYGVFVGSAVSCHTEGS